jgi:Icc-related predicted phosphoesterase
MRLTFISDTHLKHEQLVVPPSELLVHAGDFSRTGTRDETLRFLDWFARFPAEKLLIGGNWDRFAEQEPEAMQAACAERGIHWLVHQAATIAGLRVFGSPWTPRFRNMAWNADATQLEQHWQAVPEGLDLLVTHGPPKGILDRMILGAHVGDPALRTHTLRARPRVHVFGHIHEAHGRQRLDGTGTLFLNVASSRLPFPFGVRAPVLLDWETLGAS